MAIIEFVKRALAPVVCLGLLTASAASSSAQAPPQITEAVNNQQRVTLQGNIRPMPKRARDLGAVDLSAPASRVLLLLKRPANQEAALEQYIAEEHTPGTANYHHWLTPAQLGSQYGPADSDVQAVVAWLESQGLAVAKVSAAKTTIEFSGTAGQIESAFATKIHSFQLDGVNHIANITNPQIPAALAPVIAGISPLNDFHPKPLHTAPQGRLATPAPNSANPHAMSITRTPSNQPELTVPGSNGSGNFYAVAPADAATIYDVPNSALNKSYSGTSIIGTGVTIGIAGDSNVDLTNVTNYRRLFGLPAANPTVVVDGSDPGTGSDDEVEALLDLEVASAIAPGASLTLYTSQDTTFQSGLFLAIQRALDDNKINILNVSFGGCEASQGQSGNQEILNFWEQAAAQGISVTVSTGDSGSAGCDDSNTETAATVGLQVNGIASTPYNVAVGGTDFNQNSSNESTYWNTTNSSIGGSAKGFIPEIPWNDSTTADGALANNVPTKDTNGNTNIAGGGGGASSCLNPSFDANGNLILPCAGTGEAYPKPSFQSAFGTGTARQLPDVSLFAADGLHDSAWVLCASGLGADASTGATDCTADSSGSYSFQIVGGTSASSPAFAGMLALVSQQLGPNVRLGQADYALYALSKQYPATFHDVTTGNNAVVCASGSPNCGANGFLTGYDAAAGYDLASGLGSVDATQLVQNWSKLAFKATTTALTLNGGVGPLTITHGTSVNVAATVTGSGGTPTGNVAVVAGTPAPGSAVSAVQYTVPSPAVFALNGSGVASGADPYLPGGSYNVTAQYGGDGSFAPSTSTPGIPVTVNPEASVLQLAVLDFDSSGNGHDASTASTPNVPYGTWVSVSAQPLSKAQSTANPAPSYFSQATGSVTFTSASSLLNGVVPINSNGTAEIPNQVNLAYPPGTYSVSASYPGDASFTASTAASQTFVIVQSPTATSAAADTTTAGSVDVEVDPQLSSALQVSPGIKLPTGTVTITNSSGSSVGTGVLANVQTQQGTVAIAKVALNTTMLTGGSNTLSINYPGDTNYTGSTLTGFVYNNSGGSALFTLSSAPATVTVPSGGSGTTTINVTPQNGFTGTVNVSCTVAGAGSPLPTCSLSPASVSVTGTTAVTSQLTVTAVASSSAIRTATNSSEKSWFAAGGITLAGILLFGLPGRRRAWQRMLGMLLFIIAIGVVGCGGGSSSNGGGGTPAGSYTVTVTATNGSFSQTSTVTATVQ